MAELYRRYEHDKARKGVVDFDDLLLLAVRALETDRAFAARQRWRFRHLFVDEFQDVNPAQQRLLDAWLGVAPGAAVVSEPVDLCVVGDPNQAIYAWNGADPRFLTQFAPPLPGRGHGAPGRQLPLHARDPDRRRSGTGPRPADR